MKREEGCTHEKRMSMKQIYLKWVGCGIVNN